MSGYEAVRLNILRGLAAFRDFERKLPESRDAAWPTHTPLLGVLAPEDREAPDDVLLLAARESVAMGWLDGNAVQTPFGPDMMVRLTDAGYDYIRAHDMVGEVRHEALAT